MMPQTGHRLLFGLAGLGFFLGILAAFLSSRSKPAEPPVFQPAPNPYAKGIYTTGIIESFQNQGENINIYPEVGGTVAEVHATEGQKVRAGDPIISIDGSVQKATTEQLKAQAEAAHALLEELQAQPRKEVLAVAQAQVVASTAALKNVRDQFAKQAESFRLNPKSVSRDTMDNARNAVKIAISNLSVAQKQLELTEAGAWSYEIQNQEHQYTALSKAYLASLALLEKYTIRAPVTGTILSLHSAPGSYISPQGIYETYTTSMHPVLVMSADSEYLAVRCFVDEILVHRLPTSGNIRAQMSILGTNTQVPLEFVRIQPYVTPKIELSNQRLERVDVRVLPLIFKFRPPSGMKLYPGQMVDVYLNESSST